MTQIEIQSAGAEALAEAQEAAEAFGKCLAELCSNSDLSISARRLRIAAFAAIFSRNSMNARITYTLIAIARSLRRIFAT